ncbi:MAG: phosphoribosylformylglycinamidine synthase, partial [Eubacteriales bacterium]|nr:phosphoribosylformylglycinamidine synthase [Eubacteriales bacterium]
MVQRVYAEKKHGLENEAKALLADASGFLSIDSLKAVRIFNRYDADRISDADFEKAVHTVFSEPQLDLVTKHLNTNDAADYYGADLPEGVSEENCTAFAVEYLPGQYDQRADSAAQCIQILSEGERPLVRTARVYKLYGSLSDAEIAKIKEYVINPVEAREASLDPVTTLEVNYEIPTTVETVEGFIKMDDAALEALRGKLGLAMDFDDIKFCRDYFASEHRDPTITEIRMIDTYWSDHCRHTTFLTTIDGVKFSDPEQEEAWKRYLSSREALGRTKPVNFMDIATLAVKVLKKEGKLDKLDESEEINACTVKIKVNVDGNEEDWLLLFKNETHNHPTEIEPFGGAATCIGGAIRDPLSGRSYVYHAMRVTGAADPTRPLSETLPGKLPQRKLVTTAAAGYSSYGNQIGLATGMVDEIYHDGYAAKRMEIGAVVAAAPAKNVRREVPAPG